MTSNERADLDRRIQQTERATREAEKLGLPDAAQLHWREHVRLLEVQMGKRPYYAEGQAPA